MKLNNIWGYGQLFGYSALEGKNNFYNDFIGTFTKRKVEIRFEFRKWMSVYFKHDDISFKSVMSDFIDGKSKNGNFFITFADCDTLVGYSSVLPVVNGMEELKTERINDIDVYYIDTDYLSLYSKQENNLYKFIIHHSISLGSIEEDILKYEDIDIESLKNKRYEYYLKMPKCKNPLYEELYYKALSVNKVNVFSEAGNIKHIFTTPDRVPHKNMWLWDSVFHALSFLTYNEEMAKDAINAVLSMQRSDGFIPHMMTPDYISDITQPQVLAWGVYEIYKKTNDIEFLKNNVDKLDRYLKWDILNRDKNNNGLLEWKTNPLNPKCKCDESGLDNSPRFDFDLEMDAIDFNTFLARDALYLSYIYKALNNKEKEVEWNNFYETIKDKINELMFDDKTNLYYDRLFDGSLTKVVTPACFLPLFASIPSKERAELMVKELLRSDLLYTPFPFSTISTKDPTYSTDMWRGGSWINLNYFIIKGLLNYGYTDLANEIKFKTLDGIKKWYKETGVIYEFYDSKNITPPIKCDRKGKQKEEPDFRDHMHSISDFNWSSCFTLLFIQDELY